jgi:hypothetical protein
MAQSMTKPKAKGLPPPRWVSVSLTLCAGFVIGALALWLGQRMIGTSTERIIERTVTHTVPQDCPLTERQAQEVLGLEVR